MPPSNTMPSEQRARVWCGSRGFSVIEIVIVVAAVAIGAALAIPTINETIQYYDAESALQIVAAQLRQGRQQAVDFRRVTRVTFTAPRTVTTARLDAGDWTDVVAMQLPRDFEFRIEAGLPLDEEDTPDRLGAAAAVDFSGEATLFFRPDATATNSLGQISGGIVYLAKPGELETARAVTVFGSTGRIKPWHFANGVWE
ncbi:MAG: prepilin-type N-terminal cleavage/methylation domain-containing protein [Acidobacteriota bacterium]